MTGRFQEARGDSSPRRALETGLKALAIRRRLFALSPSDEKVRGQLEDSVWYTAGQYRTIGDLQHAGELYQERLRLCENALKNSTSVDERYRLGTAFTSNGSVERMLGHYDAALAISAAGWRYGKGC